MERFPSGVTAAERKGGIGKSMIAGNLVFGVVRVAHRRTHKASRPRYCAWLTLPDIAQRRRSPAEYSGLSEMPFRTSFRMPQKPDQLGAEHTRANQLKCSIELR